MVDVTFRLVVVMRSIPCPRQLHSLLFRTIRCWGVRLRPLWGTDGFLYMKVSVPLVIIESGRFGTVC